MTISRILRHWFTGRMSVGRAFPDSTLRRIEAVIGEVEAAHAGQIRFAVEGNLDTSALASGLVGRERALEVFSELRVWDTEQNNGVLIYLLLADRDVEIVADRGIHAIAGADAWEAICRTMESAFRAGRFEDGSIEGVRAVGELLRQHFPRDGAQSNELPDAPVVF